jgi:hypothetical protein
MMTTTVIPVHDKKRLLVHLGSWPGSECVAIRKKTETCEHWLKFEPIRWNYRYGKNTVLCELSVILSFSENVYQYVLHMQVGSLAFVQGQHPTSQWLARWNIVSPQAGWTYRGWNHDSPLLFTYSLSIDREQRGNFVLLDACSVVVPRFIYSLGLKMEAVRPSETSVDFYRSNGFTLPWPLGHTEFRRRNILDDILLEDILKRQFYRLGNFGTSEDRVYNQGLELEVLKFWVLFSLFSYLIHTYNKNFNAATGHYLNWCFRVNTTCFGHTEPSSDVMTHANYIVQYHSIL